MAFILNIIYKVTNLGIKVVQNIRILTPVLVLEKSHLLVPYCVNTHSIFTRSICWDKYSAFVVFSFDFYPQPPSKITRIAAMIGISGSKILVYCKAHTSILTPRAPTFIIFVVVNIVVQSGKSDTRIHAHPVMTTVLCWNFLLIKATFCKEKTIVVAIWHSHQQLFCFIRVNWLQLRSTVLKGNLCGAWCMVGSKNVAKIFDISCCYIYSM